MRSRNITILMTMVLLFLNLSFAYATEVLIQKGYWDFSESTVFTESVNYTRNDSSSVLFSLFDSTLGQLLSVEYSRVSGVANCRVYARNLSDQEGHLSTSHNVVGYYSRTPSSGESINFSAYGSGGSPVLAPFQDWTLVSRGGIDNEGSYTQYYTDQELNQFLGSGTFDLSPRIDIGFDISNITPGIENIFEANYAFEYVIRYIYEPIPEPATLILLAFGAVILKRKPQ